MIRRTSILLVFVLSLGLPPDLISQRRPGPPPERNPSVRFDTDQMLSTDSTKVRLDISYRIPFDFFVFVRDSSSPVSSSFIARADITIELLDPNGVSEARQLTHRAITAKEPPKARGTGQFLRGIVSFSLPAGVYTLVTEVADLESNRKALDKGRKITLSSSHYRTLEHSDILLTEPFSGSLDTATMLTTLSFGGDIPFGRDFSAVFNCRSADPPESLAFSWKLYRYVPEKKDSVLCLSDTVGQGLHLFKGAILELSQNSREASYRAAPAPSDNFSVVGFHLAGESLEQGNYRLSVSLRGGAEDRSIVKFFSIRWLTMPVSLRRTDLAVAATRYIMPEEEYKELQSQKTGKQTQTIEEFWKKRDPTPGTAYNEAMAEYYSRADEASVSFSTVRGVDGIQTDRGKVYILYGPPAETERRLAPSAAPSETWFYPSLSKKFLFVDESRAGDYQLFSVDTLQGRH